MFRIAPVSLLIVLAACEAENSEGVVTSRPEAVVTDLELSPSAALLTAAGQTRAFAASLPPSMAGETVFWSSSNPAEVAVDADGNVTALSDVGAARIVAQVGDEQAEALVVIAQPAANAELVSDAQLVGEVVLADEDGLPPFTYRAQLTGVHVKVGEPIVATEGSRIAGTVKKVAEAGDGTTIVDWESGPLSAVLDDFAFDLDFPIPAKAFAPTDLPDGWVANVDDGVISIERGGASAEKGGASSPWCAFTRGSGDAQVYGLTVQPSVTVSMAAMAPYFDGVTVGSSFSTSFGTTVAANGIQGAEGLCAITLQEAGVDVGGVLGAQTRITVAPQLEARFKLDATASGASIDVRVDGVTTGTYGWEDYNTPDLKWVATNASEIKLEPLLYTPSGAFTMDNDTSAGIRTILAVEPATGTIPSLDLLQAASLGSYSSAVMDLPAQAASALVRNSYSYADETTLTGNFGGWFALALEWGRELEAIPNTTFPGTQSSQTPEGTLELKLNPATNDWEGTVVTMWPTQVTGKGDSISALRVYKQAPVLPPLTAPVTLVEEIPVNGPAMVHFTYTPTSDELEGGVVFTVNAITDVGAGSEYELSPSTQSTLDACPNTKIEGGGFEGDGASLWTWLDNGDAISSYVNQAMVLPRTGDKMATVGWEQDAEVLGSAMYQDIGPLAAGTYEVTYWTKVSAEAQQVAECAARDNPRFEVGLGSFSSAPDTVDQYDGKVMYPADLLCSSTVDQTGDYYTTADWQENTATLSLAQDAEHAFLAFQVYYGNWPRYWVFIDDVVLLPDGETCD